MLQVMSPQRRLDAVEEQGNVDGSEPGQRVLVQNRFDGTWCGGFEIASVVKGPEGTLYTIRRLSDGTVLPRLFSEDVVTPQGAQGTHATRNTTVGR